jgi:TonB family protein
MKKYLILAAVIAAFSLNASASTEESYIAQYVGRTDVPRPVKVVTPRIYNSESGKVTLQFKVTPSGAVRSVAVTNRIGSVSVLPVVQAVQSWKFEPMAGQTSDLEVSLVVNVPSV